MKTAEDVIREYYRYLSIIERRQYKPPEFPSQRLLDHAAAYLRWCEAKAVREPELFLRFRLDTSRAARFRLAMRLLPSDKQAARWHLSAGSHYRVKGWTARQHEGIRPGVDHIKALRPLIPAMEAYQYYHAVEGRQDACMATPEHSGGFHPKSRICPSCPKAIACSNAQNQREGFDVAALRRGEVWALPKAIASAAIA